MGRLHSVVLNEEDCKGCTNCIKKCPTEAIRVREGKAQINTERCIDCGECIRNCPNHAKEAVTDGLEAFSGYKYTVAMPAPAVYAQFPSGVTPGAVLAGLKALGFDGVFEVARAADTVAVAIRRYLAEYRGETSPLISTACPAIVRLIQVRFPDLIDHLIPVKSPMDVAADIVKKERSKSLGLDPREIGTFFITPCPAKAISVRQPTGLTTSQVSGTVAIAEIYGDLLRKTQDVDIEVSENLHESSGYGIGWARAGGENEAVGHTLPFVVAGIQNIIQVLEEIEMGEHSEIDYLEGYACNPGCVGGPLTVTNPYVARLNILRLAQKYSEVNLLTPEEKEKIRAFYDQDHYFLDSEIEPLAGEGLDEDFTKAINKIQKLEETLEVLPGLDCGSCGSPHCEALAEDIVRELAEKTDCIFILRERVSELADELSELAKKVPPAMGQEERT